MTVSMKCTFFTLILLCLYFNAFSQAGTCLGNTLIINTGYNPVTAAAVTPVVDGTTLTSSNTDPHWNASCISAGANYGITSDALTAVSGAADVVNTVTGWASFPGTTGEIGNWINNANASYYYTDGTYGANGYYTVFTRPFRLCSADDIKININIACDNWCAGIYVDDVSCTPTSTSYFDESVTPGMNASSNYNMFTGVSTISLSLAAGTHNISVLVYNFFDGGPQPLNYTGLAIYGTVTSATGSNSIVMESSGCSSYTCVPVIVPCDSVSLPDSLHLCSGDTATIHPLLFGSNTISSITWSPATGLSSTTILSPRLTATTSGWYKITVQSLVPACSTSDSVYVQVTPSDTFLSHKDTVVCILAGNTTLNAPASYGSPIWSTGATTSSITVVDSGTYRVSALADCIFKVDTFDITPKYPNASAFTADTAFCIGGSIILSAPPGFAANTWNTGATTSSISVSVIGAYWVADPNISACTITIDTIHVTNLPLPIVALGNDTSLCPGASATLTSTGTSGSYLWSTGSTDSAITVSQAGQYVLTVTKHGCSASDTMLISGLTAPTLNLGPDTTLCKGDIFMLSAGNYTALWSTGITANTINVTDSGLYWASVTNTCGTATDTVSINIQPCDLYFPSGFTPNNDGLNDIARAVGYLHLYSDYSLSIYNRWGQRVFYTTDIYTGWDGIYNGAKADVDVYFYLIFYTLEGKRGMLKGDITLIR